MTNWLEGCADEAVVALAGDWSLEARKNQVEPPGTWTIWMIRSGRGWGKTRVGAETCRRWVNAGLCRRLHLVARTAADARDTMIEGESGLLACCRFDPANVPMYEPSKRRVTWPSGAQAILFSAEEPDTLRGPQCDGWWCDELASWSKMRETWDMLQFGARLGQHVRGLVTTTPRPVALIRELVARQDVVVTTGSTFENESNLAPSFLTQIRARYEGTRLGRQELNGEILDDNPLALWKREWLEAGRAAQAPEMRLLVVAVDPAVSARADSDETGIVAAGAGTDGRFYVLDDRSMRGSPREWALAAQAAYGSHKANLIVYEANQGGDMVAEVLRTVAPQTPLVAVHASRGKMTRAEPVAALYEQGRVSHVGFFPELEDQMCEWQPGADSPDRMDALVWALSYLMEKCVAGGGRVLTVGGSARALAGSLRAF